MVAPPTRTARWFAVATIFSVVGASAAAQEPTKLPAVIIKGARGPGTVSGTVRDKLGNPIEGVEILIPALQRRLYSAADGTFHLDSLPSGTFDVWARKIGYFPQIEKKVKTGPGAAVDFVLPRGARALPAIVSSATRGGLSGIVADTSLRGLPGVLIHIQGEGQSATTDSTGAFFVPLEAGRYFVAISKPGFLDRLVSVTIPTDSGRQISAYLQPSAVPISKWIFRDMSYRLAWRTNANSRVYTHDDMVKLGIEWIYDVVRMSMVHFHMKESLDPRCEVIIDGRGYVSLGTLTIDGIDCVEVYNNGSKSGCPRVYVWTR